MSDIVDRLVALSRSEHDDLSVGQEAADEITKLRMLLKRSCDLLGDMCDHMRVGYDAIDDIDKHLNQASATLPPSTDT